MNTKSILSVSLVMLLVIGGTSAWAQGRSRSNGHDNHHGNGKGNPHHNNDHKDRNHHNNSKPQYSYHDHDRGRYDRRNVDCYDHRRVVHVYHPAPVERRVVHHYYHGRPRYIYYRDYDVYYDCHQQVYISFGGRNWSVSAGIPVVMQRVDVRTIVTTDVDYYDDNFTAYLETRRPGGRLYAEW